MELCSSNALAEAVDISCIVVERDERSVADEDVSKVFETASELVSAGIEILDGIVSWGSYGYNGVIYRKFYGKFAVLVKHASRWIHDRHNQR
ncbi:hypothetical protein GCM10008985_31630 [Halococcus dombrowskii]|uniref:Uncharacterized protein n=1 Tax=Halococcus dombrowskii TaxID=179637 RepID=A0AAV3SL25_HALDO